MGANWGTTMARDPANRMGCGAFVLLVIGIGGIWSAFDKPSAAPIPPPIFQPVAAAADRIPYEVVEQWNLPGGGYGRVIVVDRKYRNETDLRKLARSLRADTFQDRDAFVFIYDDKQAAAQRRAALNETLGKRDLAHHDKHMIGTYFRNATTGFHALTITLSGVDGPAKEIPQ